MQIILLALLMSANIYAATPLGMKPGKWRINTMMKNAGGKAEDPMAKLGEAMKNMTPEQRKEMQAMMAKMGQDKKQAGPQVGFDSKGMTVCYTKELLENGLDNKKDREKSKCKISDHKQTAKMASMNFKCENGSSGRSEWNVVDETHIKGKTTTISDKGEKHEMAYKAEFLSSKCD